MSHAIRKAVSPGGVKPPVGIVLGWLLSAMRFVAGGGKVLGKRAVKVRSVTSDMAGARLQVHLKPHDAQAVAISNRDIGTASDGVSRTVEQHLPGSVAKLKLPSTSLLNSARDRCVCL